MGPKTIPKKCSILTSHVGNIKLVCSKEVINNGLEAWDEVRNTVLLRNTSVSLEKWSITGTTTFGGVALLIGGSD